MGISPELGLPTIRVLGTEVNLEAISSEDNPLYGFNFGPVPDGIRYPSSLFGRPGGSSGGLFGEPLAFDLGQDSSSQTASRQVQISILSVYGMRCQMPPTVVHRCGQMLNRALGRIFAADNSSTDEVPLAVNALFQLG